MSYVLNGFFGKNVSVNDICTTYVNQHKDEDGIWDDKYNPYRNGVLVEDLQPLMDAYFTTVDFTSYKDAIDAGYPVMTDVKSNVDGPVHNVLVVGYNLDWDVIYMDPAFGRIMRSDFSDLLDDYHYVITGVKNK